MPLFFCAFFKTFFLVKGSSKSSELCKKRVKIYGFGALVLALVEQALFAIKKGSSLHGYSHSYMASLVSIFAFLRCELEALPINHKCDYFDSIGEIFSNFSTFDVLTKYSESSKDSIIIISVNIWVICLLDSKWNSWEVSISGQSNARRFLFRWLPLRKKAKKHVENFRKS